MQLCMCIITSLINSIIISIFIKLIYSDEAHFAKLNQIEKAAIHNVKLRT